MSDLAVDELAALHLAAVMARLREADGLAEDAYDDAVKGQPERYARVYTNSGFSSQTRFSSLNTTKTFTYVVHSVGTTAEQALWVNARVHRKLDDAVLSVAGRKLRRLTHRVSRPIDIDVSGPEPLHFLVDQFDLVSDPAAT